MSRPTSYTQEIADEICRRLICGDDDKPESLRSICRDENMPGLSTVMAWLNKHEPFQEQYTRAREVQQEIVYEEIIEIADNCTDDVMFLTSDDNDGEGAKAVIKHSAIQRAKLQIDTRKWAMGRMSPKKWGDKLDLNHSGNLETVTDEQLDSRIAQLIEQAGTAGPVGRKGKAKS